MWWISGWTRDGHSSRGIWRCSNWTGYKRTNWLITDWIRCYFSPSLISRDLFPCKFCSCAALSLGKPTLSWLKAVRLGKLQQLPWRCGALAMSWNLSCFSSFTSEISIWFPMPIGSRGYPLGSLGARACLISQMRPSQALFQRNSQERVPAGHTFIYNFHASCHFKFDT